MLGLINVSTHGHDATHTGRIGLARSGTGGMHDTVLGGAEEIGGTTQPVQHPGAHDAGGVRVGVHVDFDGSVHADAAESANNLGGVGDLLRAEEQLIGVAVPVVVEALEAVWGESNGGGGREVEIATIKQVEEGVLQHLGPDLEALEVGAALAETTDDRVGDVTDA